MAKNDESISPLDRARGTFINAVLGASISVVSEGGGGEKRK